MWQMIKYELEKICGRKIVWISLLGLLVFNFVGTLVGQNSQYKIVTPDGKILQGEAGKEYTREKMEYYKGPLTEEKKEEILRTERAADLYDYSYLNSLCLYNSMNQNFEYFYSPLYGKTVEEAFTDRGIQVEIGNAQRWTQVFSFFPQIAMVLGFVIIIGVSGVFSEEYIRKMDALLLTTKHGKRKCIQAKVLASFLFAAISYGLFLLTTMLPFLWEDGLTGWNAGVQLDVMNGLCDVGYTMNCADAAVLLSVSGFLAMLLLTALTLLISVWSKTPFISIIVAAVLYFMPMFLTSMLPEEIICLTPLGASTSMALRMPKFHLGGLELFFQAKVLLLTIAATVAAWVGSRRIFAGHQVA